MALYHSAAERLKQAGRLYPCFESEAELRAKRDHRIKRGLPPIYDRAMLKLTPAQRAAAEAGGKRPYWRFRLSDRTVEWHDLVLGRRQAKLGIPVRPGAACAPTERRCPHSPPWSTTSHTGISHVIRGEDHVTITAIQMDLLAALGAEPRELSFAHLPLLTEDAGKCASASTELPCAACATTASRPARLPPISRISAREADPAPSPMAALVEDFDLGRFSQSSGGSMQRGCWR